MTTSSRRRAARRLIFVIAVLSSQTLYAQGPSLPAAAMVAAASEPDSSAVRLLVGRSTLLEVGAPIARVSLTSPEVADALVTTPSQLLINGKMPGTISMFVWDRGGSIRRFEIIVQRDLARLSEQLRQLFPGEQIDVQSNGKDIVLSGLVSNKDVGEKAVNVAAGYVDKKEEVISLVRVQEGPVSNQVLLRVRFAEVNRNALTEIGTSFFTGPNGYKNYIGRVTTEQYPAPTFDNSDPTNPKLVFSDFLNFFLFDTKNQLGAVLKALQTKGMLQSLAEPNLVAESGKEASFLAGGEVPIPVAQGSGNSLVVTIQYKEYGIRLNFLPVVNGNRVHLKVRPEVSALDYSNAVLLNGFRIPALTTRRTETELELQDNQTFAISGLLNASVTQTMQKIPGIGDIPILGELFKSRQNQKDRTELVVMITPQILPNGSPGVTNKMPQLMEEFLPPPPPKKGVELPPPAFQPQPPAPQAAMPTPAPKKAAQAQGNPDAAAAAVSALAPAAPKLVTPPPASATAGGGQVQEAPRPLTRQEQQALERARKQELEQAKKAEQQKRQADLDAQAKASKSQTQSVDDKQAAKLAEKQAEADRKQAEADRKQAEKDKAEQEKLAREQARRDGEAARKAAEDAKRQAEIDKKQQKAIDEAAAKLKAAEAAYQAELAKKKNPQTDR